MKNIVQASTGNGTNLLAAIKKAIDNRSIQTWSYDKDGDFTHDADQWKNKAWLRPTVTSGGVDFKIIQPENTQIDSATRGVYLGRFSEMLVTHFDSSLTSIKVMD